MNANPSDRDIVRTVDRIRMGWSQAERTWRRQVGELRRRELLAMVLKVELTAEPVPVAG